MHYFDTKCVCICKFAPLENDSVLILSSKQKYVHLKTHWASHTLDQNLAIILWQFNYGKNSIIVLIPDLLEDAFQVSSSHFDVAQKTSHKTDVGIGVDKNLPQKKSPKLDRLKIFYIFLSMLLNILV